jgi:hypothetical protein
MFYNRKADSQIATKTMRWGLLKVAADPNGATNYYPIFIALQAGKWESDVVLGVLQCSSRACLFRAHKLTRIGRSGALSSSRFKDLPQMVKSLVNFCLTMGDDRNNVFGSGGRDLLFAGGTSDHLPFCQVSYLFTRRAEIENLWLEMVPAVVRCNIACYKFTDTSHRRGPSCCLVLIISRRFEASNSSILDAAWT